MTNYDRIKAMSVEEMADALFAFKECDRKNCPMAKNHNRCYMICEEASVIKKWLEQKVEEC